MKRIFFLLIAAIVIIPAILFGIEFIDEPGKSEPGAPVTDTAQQIARGKYLTGAGNCMACHTVRGGQPYAGGRAIPTPFGTIFAPNVTPDVATGIGSWNADDFWRALHNGKSKDGSFLYPAFPYPSYTKVTRADSDAMFAYFRTLEPVRLQNREHELRFPYNQRFLLAGWRALYFRPGVYQAQPGQTADWNRGAYLIQGLGHCSACHTDRNALGASIAKADLGGGMIPILNWYAPSLTSAAEAGLANWEVRHIADLLKTGVSERGAVYGPMAEVVGKSLQHLSDPDIDAMAGYLKSLTQPSGVQAPQVAPAPPSDAQTAAILQSGAKLYEKHCAECHKASGAGAPTGYPPLAGNGSLTAPLAVNPIRVVLNGGYPPSTTGNPRPYGMPPFGPVLNDEEVAAVVSYIRNSWGNSARMVTASEVKRYRGVPLD
ncbi:MAG: alcohol dehydrogenase [Herminiimonas sp.]|nr:alcohol dehydrogenase [Herminiimonas sp.]